MTIYLIGLKKAQHYASLELIFINDPFEYLFSQAVSSRVSLHSMVSNFKQGQKRAKKRCRRRVKDSRRTAVGKIEKCSGSCMETLQVSCCLIPYFSNSKNTSMQLVTIKLNISTEPKNKFNELFGTSIFDST